MIAMHLWSKHLVQQFGDEQFAKEVDIQGGVNFLPDHVIEPGHVCRTMTDEIVRSSLHTLAVSYLARDADAFPGLVYVRSIPFPYT